MRLGQKQMWCNCALAGAWLAPLLILPKRWPVCSFVRPLILALSFFRVTANVPRLGDSGAPEAGKFQLKYKIKIEKQSVDLLDLAPLLPNRCCLQYFLFSRIANFVRSIRFREAEILRFIFLLNFVFRQFVVSKLFFSQVFCL